MKKFLALSHSDVVFIMLINVKMPTIVCILTFMSRINCVLSWVEYERSFITSGPGLQFFLIHVQYIFLSISFELNLWISSYPQALKFVLDGCSKEPSYCLFVCFCCFTSHVNSYDHCGTVSSLNHTFSWAGLSKRLTSNLCTCFRL